MLHLRPRRLLAAIVALALAASSPIMAFAQDAPTSPTPAAKPAAKAKAAKANKDAEQKPELTADEIIEKANAWLDDARMITADFVQIGPDGQRTEGQLYVQRPGKLLFHYNPPSQLEIVADGRSVAVRDHKLGTQDLYFIQQTPLKFLVADHIDLRRDVKIKRVASEPNAVLIEVEDKETFGGKSDVTLVFDPETFALKQWTVIDPQGFQTVVTLFDIDLVSKPDPSLFAIDSSAAANQGPQRH